MVAEEEAVVSAAVVVVSTAFVVVTASLVVVSAVVVVVSAGVVVVSSVMYITRYYADLRVYLTPESDVVTQLDSATAWEEWFVNQSYIMSRLPSSYHFILHDLTAYQTVITCISRRKRRAVFLFRVIRTVIFAIADKMFFYTFSIVTRHPARRTNCQHVITITVCTHNSTVSLAAQQ